MSDEHDDDALSHLFGPAGETGQHPQQPAEERSVDAEEPAPAALTQPAAPAEPAPFSWEHVEPSWEQPTTALRVSDVPTPPAPAPATPDPLAWLLAGQQVAPTPVEPPAPTTAFEAATPPTAPAPGPSTVDPFGVGSAAATLGIAPAADELATRRFDAPPNGPVGPSPTAGGPGGDEPGNGKRLLIILGSIGGALLIAIIILASVLVTRGQGAPAATSSTAAPTISSPSSSPSASRAPSTTPSATPSTSATPSPAPTATDTDPPAPTPPGISASASPATCASAASTFTISWQSTNATTVAVNGPNYSRTFSGDQAAKGTSDAIPCPATSASYAVTAAGPAGKSAVNVSITSAAPTTSPTPQAQQQAPSSQ